MTVQKKKSKKHKYIAIVLVILLIISLTVFIAVRKSSNKEKQNDVIEDITDGSLEENKDSLISIGNGIEIIDVSSYSGAFIEDGSDVIVQNIAAATIKNNGSEEIQIMNLTVTDEFGNDFEFEFTTLLPGEQIYVLEKNKKNYVESKIVKGTINNYAVFQSSPSLQNDKFLLMCDEGKITVRNLTDKKIDMGRLFYKKYVGNMYIGGITYMVSFSDVGPQEEITLTPTHFNDSDSRIVFITYAE